MSHTTESTVKWVESNSFYPRELEQWVVSVDELLTWLDEQDRPAAVKVDNERAEMVRLLKRWYNPEGKPHPYTLELVSATETLLRRLGELDD